MAASRHGTFTQALATLGRIHFRFEEDPTSDAAEALRAATLQTLRMAKTAIELEKLFTSEACAAGVFGSAPLWPEVADVLVNHARSWKKTHDAAMALAWLVPLSTSECTNILWPDASSKIRSDGKRAMLASAEKYVELFRSWAADKEVERRIAGAHLLAWCGSTQDDLSLLGALATPSIRVESAPHALGTVLLSLGVIARRLGGEAPNAALEVLALHQEQRDPFVKACIAASTALASLSLDEEGVAVLAQSLTSPVRLPAYWGFPPRRPMFRTDAVACAVLRWVKTAHPSAAVEALVAVAEAPEGPEGRLAADTVADALLATTFESRGDRIPAAGIALEDVGDLERRALGALAGNYLFRDRASIERLGFPASAPEHIAAFLAADSPEWRAVDVRLPEGVRRWHFARLWLSAAYSEVPRDAAAAAIAEGYTDGEAFTLMCRASVYRSAIEARLGEPAYWQRACELGLEVMALCRGRGFDVLEELRGRALDDGGWVAPYAALFALAEAARLGKDPPRAIDGLLVEAATRARAAEPLRTLFATLPRERLESILTKAPEAWLLWDLCLTEPVVDKILLHVRKVTDDRGRAIALLASEGASIVPLLETYEEDDDWQISAQSVIAPAKALIRKRES